jgi:hypothetical protein
MKFQNPKCGSDQLTFVLHPCRTVDEPNCGNEIDCDAVATMSSLLQDVLLYNMTDNQELVPVVQGYLSGLLQYQDAFAAAVGSSNMTVAFIRHKPDIGT